MKRRVFWFAIAGFAVVGMCLLPGEMNLHLVIGWLLFLHRVLPRITADPVSLDHARKGSLYPDHVVFLGPGVFVLGSGETLDAGLGRARIAGLGDPRIALIPDKGVLVHRRAVAAVEPMARCLADVTARIGRDEPVRALPDRDVDALVNWDAEKYRQSLARAG